MTIATITNLSNHPNWLRFASVIGVLWYIFGFSQFVGNMTMDVAGAVASGAITEAHGAAITATPALIWAAYFVACVLGIIGAIQLFRGHAGAFVLFVLSLFFDVIYFGWFHVSGTAAARPTEAGPIAIIVLTIGVAFTLLSYRRA